MTSITLQSIPSLAPSSDPKQAPDHWIGSPPTSFCNPWPSWNGAAVSRMSMLEARFGRNRNFVPVPTDKKELVQVQKPDWGVQKPSALKATWLGHAGFLVELPSPAISSDTGTNGGATSATKTAQRGIRLLVDAVFAPRMSPVSFAGPKRFTPLPCTIDDLPEVDAVLISHNHYDHLDIETIRHVNTTRGDKVHFFVPLGLKEWFTTGSGLAIPSARVTECDWWEGVQVSVDLKSAGGADDGGVARANLICCPSQHMTGRGILDQGKTLWCSWAIEEVLSTTSPSSTTTTTITTSSSPSPRVNSRTGKKLYFSGDTAYRSTAAPSPCPAFAQIGERLGPFDLALLPIGCFLPRELMSNVHASPEDSLEIHKDVRSKKTIGMHYGAIRGGISAHYEDVREPPRRWRECAEKEGRWESGECGLCDVGETVCV